MLFNSEIKGNNNLLQYLPIKYINGNLIFIHFNFLSIKKKTAVIDIILVNNSTKVNDYNDSLL